MLFYDILLILRYIDTRLVVCNHSVVFTMCFLQFMTVFFIKYLNCFILKIIKVEQYTNKYWQLTDEGKDVAANGSHEARVYNAVPPEGIPQAQIMVASNTNIYYLLGIKYRFFAPLI